MRDKFYYKHSKTHAYQRKRIADKLNMSEAEAIRFSVSMVYGTLNDLKKG